MDNPTLTNCPICGAPRRMVSNDTWFFVMSAGSATLVCSRQCLIAFVNALPEKTVPPIARLKHGGCHVITPHRRE